MDITVQRNIVVHEVTRARSNSKRWSIHAYIGWSETTVPHFRRVSELESQVDLFKHQYVYLLQSCIRMPVSDRRPIDAVEVKLFGGDVVRLKNR